ncbi:MAG: hypothetical protein R3C56_33650 [Pirellulaceae bacterium]
MTLIGNTDSEIANASQLMSVFTRELLPELQEQLPDVCLIWRPAGIVGRNGIVDGLFSPAGAVSAGIYAILSYQFESWLEPSTGCLRFPWR